MILVNLQSQVTMVHAGDFPTEACCSCTELDQLRWTGSGRTNYTKKGA